MRTSVNIEFNGMDVAVKFKGVWTRSTINLAYNAMLSKLPAYIAQLRKEMDDDRRKREPREE